MASTSIVFDILARDRASSTFNRVGTASAAGSRHLSRMGDSLKRVAKVGALAAAAGALYAIKWGFEAANAAGKDLQAQKLLGAALKKNADATPGQIAGAEKWIATQGKLYGVSMICCGPRCSGWRRPQAALPRLSACLPSLWTCRLVGRSRWRA